MAFKFYAVGSGVGVWRYGRHKEGRSGLVEQHQPSVREQTKNMRKKESSWIYRHVNKSLKRGDTVFSYHCRRGDDGDAPLFPRVSGSDTEPTNIHAGFHCQHFTVSPWTHDAYIGRSFVIRATAAAHCPRAHTCSRRNETRNEDDRTTTAVLRLAALWCPPSGGALPFRQRHVFPKALDYACLWPISSSG